MKIKSILPIGIATAAVVTFGYHFFNLNGNQTAPVAQTTINSNPQNVAASTITDTNTHNQVTLNQQTPAQAQALVNAGQQSANFDRRSMVIPSQKPAKPTMTSEQSTKVMAAKQVEMEKLVAQYNASLSDPKRKADIERKFKLHMEDYKQALIAKSQRGEL